MKSKRYWQATLRFSGVWHALCTGVNITTQPCTKPCKDKVKPVATDGCFAMGCPLCSPCSA